MAIASAFSLSVSMSSPNNLIATSERTPVTISSTRSEIGWAITICTPGKVLTLSRIASAMSSCVHPLGHSSRGLRLTIGVDSFWLCESAGLSPRPTPEKADFTPGTCITIRIASISSLMDSSSEILGTRFMPGTIEPSFISGMNAVPSKGNNSKAPTNAPPDTMMVFLPLVSVQSNNRR